jgi:hypothetical protein
VKTKWNLSKSEQRTHAANADRLKSTGVAIGVENTSSSGPPLLRIEQSGYSDIYAGTLGGMALAICVRFTVLKSGIFICDYEIDIPGCNAEILLVPPEEGSRGYRVFRWLNIERAAVLNDRILGGRPLPLGRDLDGFLVAQSFDLLPRQFQSGMNIGASICLVDQAGDPYVSEVELMVERCEQQGASAKKGKGLIVPEEVIPARHERQDRVHPSSAVGGTAADRSS